MGKHDFELGLACGIIVSLVALFVVEWIESVEGSVEQGYIKGKIVQPLSFDDVKHFLAFYESTNGRYKYAKNKNSVDVGVYQINSRMFDPKLDNPDIKAHVDSLFYRYGVGYSLNHRIFAAVNNDALNEELARIVFEHRGLRAWYSAKKFQKYLEADFNLRRNK